MRQKNVELNTVFCLFFSGIDSFFIIVSKRHIYNTEFRLMEQHIKKKCLVLKSNMTVSITVEQVFFIIVIID